MATYTRVHTHTRSHTHTHTNRWCRAVLTFKQGTQHCCASRQRATLQSARKRRRQRCTSSHASTTRAPHRATTHYLLLQQHKNRAWCRRRPGSQNKNVLRDAVTPPLPPQNTTPHQPRINLTQTSTGLLLEYVRSRVVAAGAPECSELRASYEARRGAVAARAASLEALTPLLSSGASSNSPESSSSRILREGGSNKGRVG